MTYRCLFFYNVLTFDQIPLYLLHGPDESVSVAEILGAIQTLYEEGRFEKVTAAYNSTSLAQS